MQLPVWASQCVRQITTGSRLRVKLLYVKPSENTCVNGLEHTVLFRWFIYRSTLLHTNMFGYLLFVYMYFCPKVWNRHEMLQTGRRDQLASCFLINFSLPLTFFMVSPVGLLAVRCFEKSVLQIYRQLHTQANYHIHFGACMRAPCGVYCLPCCQYGGNILLFIMTQTN